MLQLSVFPKVAQAGSPVISVDPARLDTTVFASEYWRGLWRTEGWTATRTPALPDLERAAPGRTLLDIRRAHLAAAWRLGGRGGPQHEHGGWEHACYPWDAGRAGPRTGGGDA